MIVPLAQMWCLEVLAANNLKNVVIQPSRMQCIKIHAHMYLTNF